MQLHLWCRRPQGRVAHCLNNHNIHRALGTLMRAHLSKDGRVLRAASYRRAWHASSIVLKPPLLI